MSGTSLDNASSDEDLFIKNTDSFRCLAQVPLSRSSLLRHPLYPFPPLPDHGLDEAINYIHPDPIYDTVGCDNYVRLCKSFGIVAHRRVITSLPKKVLNLKYYGLREEQVFAIMDTLTRNKFVEQVILEDNWLKPKSMEHISTMLKANDTVRILSLRECRIQPEGACVLDEGISSTLSLKELDLSFNSLDDEGIAVLEDGLTSNQSITILILSHNNLGEEAAITLGRILEDNTFLQELDLSWNYFCSPLGNKHLFGALSKSKEIVKLNLAWNSIATKEATRPILGFLSKTKTLQYFDICNNRLTKDSFKNIRFGIARCKQLSVLKIGSNPLTPDEASSVLKCFGFLKNLLEIDLKNTFVYKEHLSLINENRAKGKKIEIGGIIGNYDIHGPDQIKLLFARAKYLAMKAKKKKNRVDFGHAMLLLPQEDITREDFEAFLKPFEMKKLDQNLVGAILDKFPAPKHLISCNDMKNTYIKYYPNTVLPPPKSNTGAQKQTLAKTGQEIRVIEQHIQNYTQELEKANLEEEEECFE